MINDWVLAFQDSLTSIWLGVAGLIPKILLALVLFIIGWVIGRLLGKAVAQIVRAIKVDAILRRANFEDVLKKAGYNLDSGKFFGVLVEWFVIVVFLVASLDVLGLSHVNTFLNEVVLVYLPKVIAAAFILLVSVVIADAMQKVVVSAAAAANIKSANFAGVVTKWAIWIFAVMIALSELGIAAQFVNTLFTGIIVAVSIAFGLSFGLGGQDSAHGFIEKVKGEISHHQ